MYEFGYAKKMRLSANALTMSSQSDVERCPGAYKSTGHGPTNLQGLAI